MRIRSFREVANDKSFRRMLPWLLLAWTIAFAALFYFDAARLKNYGPGPQSQVEGK